MDALSADFDKRAIATNAASPYEQYLRKMLEIAAGADEEAASRAMKELQRQSTVLLDLGKEVDSVLSEHKS